MFIRNLEFQPKLSIAPRTASGFPGGVVLSTISSTFCSFWPRYSGCCKKIPQRCISRLHDMNGSAGILCANQASSRLRASNLHARGTLRPSRQGAPQSHRAPQYPMDEVLQKWNFVHKARQQRFRADHNCTRHFVPGCCSHIKIVVMLQVDCAAV